MTDTYAPLDHQIHGYRMIYVCVVLAFSAFSLGESDMISSNRDSLSRPVITRNHRQLKGFTFNSFHSESLVSCGLRCQRNPRCLSTNFRAGSSFSAEGICELNDGEKELNYEEGTIYTQFSDLKVTQTT